MHASIRQRRRRRGRAGGADASVSLPCRTMRMPRPFPGHQPVCCLYQTRAMWQPQVHPKAPTGRHAARSRMPRAPSACSWARTHVARAVVFGGLHTAWCSSFGVGWSVVIPGRHPRGGKEAGQQKARAASAGATLHRRPPSVKGTASTPVNTHQHAQDHGGGGGADEETVAAAARPGGGRQGRTVLLPPRLHGTAAASSSSVIDGGC